MSWAIVPRKQFSIRVLLGLVCLAAIGVACWKAVVWEPPTNQFSLYERAQAYHGWTATIGPNQIRIVSIARNDRDGSVLVATPDDGESEEVVIPNRQTLIDCARWLDVVQIELRPGDDVVDIVELRVFDHRTRQALQVDHPRCGYRVVHPNVVHLYGCGETLPQAVDVWMRVHSRGTDEVGTLARNMGASVTVDDCEFTVSEMQAGYAGWNSQQGLFPPEGQHHNETGVILNLNPDPPPRKLYQITALTDNGQKHVSVTLNLGGGKALVDFQVPLEEIRHFEIRPWGIRERFFFDGVELPKLTTPKKGYFAPPTATVQVNGGEIKHSLTEFAPLDVELMIRDGRPYSGSAAGPNFIQLKLREDGPINKGKECSLVLMTRGIASLPYQVRFRQSGSTAWTNDRGMRPRGRHSASSANQELFERNYQSPLSEIQAVEISIRSFKREIAMSGNITAERDGY